MKQNITKEQWDELDKKQKDCFQDKVYPHLKKYEILPGIGRMIDFLGENLEEIKNCFGGIQYNKKEMWKIYTDQGMDGGLDIFNSKELCDSLWEAVKYKLNDQN